MFPEARKRATRLRLPRSLATPAAPEGLAEISRNAPPHPRRQNCQDVDRHQDPHDDGLDREMSCDTVPIPIPIPIDSGVRAVCEKVREGAREGGSERVGASANIKTRSEYDTE